MYKKIQNVKSSINEFYKFCVLMQSFVNTMKHLAIGIMQKQNTEAKNLIRKAIFTSIK